MKIGFQKYGRLFCLVACVLAANICCAQKSKGYELSTNKLKDYVRYFNSIDTETVKNFVTNDKAEEWLSKNVPLFECPDTTIEKIYYYRWWTFRKHLKQTPDGFVFTEFITPMNHGGKYNTISSGLGHHIYEGRWLRDPQYIMQYINFWLHVDPKTTKPHLRNFSSWLQDAVYNFYLVNRDLNFLGENMQALNSDYDAWVQERQLPDGKFWQYDVRDAMEESISGGRRVKNVRPTINSYMYGNARAMKKMADLLSIDSLQKKYEPKISFLQNVVEDYLWNDTSSFFEVRLENQKFAQAREAIGFIPWYFNLPSDKEKYEKQWLQIRDTTGFKAPWGLTTAERRHPTFRTHGSGHGCEWDGPVWPYATTQTLRGLSNFLNNYDHNDGVSSNDFYDELHKYAWSHQKNGKPYLGEYQDEKNGYWLKGDNPRSSYYNHSCFADLVISDLIGIKPSETRELEIKPLIPAGKWDWFCVDKVPYHGMLLTIVWDKNGTKYGLGKGLKVFADGKQYYSGKELKGIKVKLK